MGQQKDADTNSSAGTTAGKVGDNEEAQALLAKFSSAATDVGNFIAVGINHAHRVIAIPDTVKRKLKEEVETPLNDKKKLIVRSSSQFVGENKYF